MNSAFSSLDWAIFATYLVILALSSYFFSKVKITSTKEYFTSANSIPALAAAISIVATTQSAATFLGVPEFAYKHNFTLIGFYISSLLAVLFVAYVFVPKFYAIKALTVYELLEKRYGENSKRQAGVMFLVGRVLASGARLYIAALAVSMILFLDISFLHMVFAISLLLIGALIYTYFGGVKSVIYSDIIQTIVYVSAGAVVFYYLYTSLHVENIYETLNSLGKLQLLETSIDGKFSIYGLLGGWLLLNIAAFGLDQDMSQRVLSCKDTKEAQRSLILSILFTIPIVLLFLGIGALLYLHYQNNEIVQSFGDEKITIFMYYILNEMPEGLRGFVTVGAIAAALSSTNSVLGAMSSVAIEDIYKPYKLKKEPSTNERHFLKASRTGVLLFALALFSMAVISYFWQRYLEVSLIAFALGVMAFAYTGLLGVYFSAIFTNRGSAKLVPFALFGGFLTVLLLQTSALGFSIGYDWQIAAGTLIAFLIMMTGAENG
ncbi:sodium:solute symporter [Sulfurimonas microaerophilic]|uniref:sodium:solute symporter n=1 Tax=Sulfurimonas microaerophilic TaxID=3058392 RepID=UPI00271513F0|nr:sodium:solute symporter [Sulfurimonas sp. hsl 1-7]